MRCSAEHRVRQAASGEQAGFTLVESLVAFTLLIGGFTVFFWQMRQHAVVQARSVERAYALEAAQSDIESLQGIPQDWVHDTSYTVRRHAIGFHLVRHVYDTADFANSREELKLDAQLKPVALKEPREVQVLVFREGASPAGERDPGRWKGLGFSEWLGDADLFASGTTTDPEGPTPLVRLTVRLGEYKP